MASARARGVGAATALTVIPAGVTRGLGPILWRGSSNHEGLQIVGHDSLETSLVEGQEVDG